MELVAGNVAAVCPLVPGVLPFAGPSMVTDAASSNEIKVDEATRRVTVTDSNGEIKFDKATSRWQCEFHDWVHMLWHSKAWFHSKYVDNPVGSWAFASVCGQVHFDPDDGDVVISRQEFARLLWRCEPMCDRPPICQWIAQDECPEDIWWRA